MKNLKKFIQSQKLLILATADGKPWVCNLYFGADDELNIYFVSSADTRHGKHLAKNSSVAFSIVWFNADDLGDRKAVQGEGICEVLLDKTSVKSANKAYNKQLGSERNPEEYIKKDATYRVHKLTPSYMKYWDDELNGGEEVKEFEF
jgi:uncharacterized protein YhbP (UPF0306 family)